MCPSRAGRYGSTPGRTRHNRGSARIAEVMNVSVCAGPTPENVDGTTVGPLHPSRRSGSRSPRRHRAQPTAFKSILPTQLVSARGHHAHDGSMNRYPASFNGNGIADVVGDVTPWVSDLARDGTPLTSFLRTYSWETDDEAWWDGSERRIAREERVAPRLAVDGSRRGRGPGRAERLLRDRLPLRSRMK